MAIISLRKSVDRLDYEAEQRSLLQQALSRCVQAASQYAIELDPNDAAALRSNLECLAGKAGQIQDTEEWAQWSADFRGELRTYHDEEQQKAERLRGEMATLVETIQGFIANVTQHGSDHERTLRKEFDTLEAAAETGDLDAIRKAIRSAVDTALKSCEEIRNSREVVIAQLQDEIRNLHREVDNERRAALTDPMTNVWNRGKLDSRIKDLILLNEPFCIFLIGVPEVVSVARQDPRLVSGCLQALAGRLQGIAAEGGEIGMTGRWSEEVFAIVFNLPLVGVPVTLDEMRETLSGTYAVQLDGKSHKLHLDANVLCVERPKDSSETAFYLHLGQAAFSAISH